MSGLVEDLLLLAHLDAGRELAHDTVDLSMLSIMTLSDAHAAGPNHVWNLDIPEEPCEVIGDEARLQQVLVNLLANSRVHTPEGTEVTLALTPQDDGGMVISVSNNGPEIPTELRSSLFQRFSRGDTSRNRTGGSTGLGLAIAQAIVTAHGGTITVESSPERTTFSVVLPPAGSVPIAEGP
jgi:two-component system OmpR family sensor kinase